MKKTSIVLLSSLLLLTACASQSKPTSTSSSSSQSSAKVSLSAEEEKELKTATSDYKTFVEENISQLLTDTENFRDLLKDGKLEEAKKVYPLIRMNYERSEPLAESFSELDQKIDFRLVDYVDEHSKDKNPEEGWSGFHKIERILWEENTTKGTESYADQLVNDVKELKAKVSTIDVTPELMLTGAVDLLNEVATSKITGEEEVYSHTDLYDFRANIQGAEKIYQLFKSLIEKKDAKLAETLDSEFANVNALLDKYMVDGENYKSYTDLTKEDTKTLAEAVTKLGEPLSNMGKILGED